MLAHQIFRWANLIRLLFFRSFTLGEDDTAVAGTDNRCCTDLDGGVENSTATPGQFLVHSGILLFRPQARRWRVPGTVKDFVHVPCHQGTSGPVRVVAKATDLPKLWADGTH